MFKAIVLACSISAPADCLEWHDSLGPYKTEGRCEARAFEMARQINEAVPDTMARRWRCQLLKKGQLS
tara:strand:+ start:500 stop:703 length:204 start_codon:yes stop_codon:yes gene_type:complete